MKTTIKRIISGILAVAMIFGSSVTTFAETADKNFSAAATDDDKELPECYLSQTYEADEDSVYFEWDCWGAKRFFVYQKINGKYKKILDTDDDPDRDRMWSHYDCEPFVDGGGIYVTGLKPYTGYTFKVCALIYNDKTKTYDKVYSNTVTCRTYPLKTKIVSARASKNAIRLYWKKVKCEGYKLQVYDKAKEKWVTKRTVGKNVTNARIPGLAPNRKYRVRVVVFGRTPKGTRACINLHTKDPSTILWARPDKTKTIRTKKR